MSTPGHLHHIALVSQSKNVEFKDVARVSAALQKQVTRDFGPIWEIQATVDAFAELEQVPIDYWPIIVMDDIHTDAAGIHLDKDGQPFALVKFSPGWSLTASHECLEMLCDPSGDKVLAGKSPNPDQGRVLFLVEVCDPSEASAFAYTVNGVAVSDFYTPRYFDPVAAPGVRYSFTCAITKPRQILKGGYISWHDPKTDHWNQEVYFGGKPEFRDLGVFTRLKGSFRSQIYKHTPEASKHREHEVRFTAASAFVEAAESSVAKAKNLRTQIAKLM